MDSIEGRFASELYVDSEFLPRVTERLFEMQRSRTLCDVNLGLSNAVHSLSVHRCVLAANSPAFCAILSEVPTLEVMTLTGGDLAVVESLIEYMYSGRLRVSLSSARDLLRLGKNYNIGNVVCLVAEHLSKSLSLSTWAEIFRIAAEFQMTSIEQETAEYISVNIDKILEVGKVEQLDHDMLQRILTSSQSDDDWKWKIRVILRWCEGAYSDRAVRVPELLDLINFKATDIFSLKVQLTDESMKNSHNAFCFAIQDCLSRAENSTMNLSTDKDSSREIVGREHQMVSEIDENDEGQLAELDEEEEPNCGRQTSEDGERCFVKCYHHRIQWSESSAGKRSLESSHTEVVSISSAQQIGDQGENLSEPSAKELNAHKDNKGKNPVTSKTSILTSESTLETERTLPSGESTTKQPLSSLHVSGVLVSRYSNSTTVNGDGSKMSTRVRRKRAKTVDEMYACPLCPKQFPTSSGQQRHTKGHGSEIPLLCEVCGFSTRHIASMNVHKQTHFGKRLKCGYVGCNYSTIRLTDLEDHLHSHIGIKRHVCVVCGKAFSRRTHHARHEKIHTDPKKFACSKCKYQTGRSDKMREHFRRHHQPKTDEDGTNSRTTEAKAGNRKRRRKIKEEKDT